MKRQVTLRVAEPAMGSMFCLKLRTKLVDHVFVGAFTLNLRLFIMPCKARCNLRCVLNIIFFFCLFLAFNRPKRIYFSLYSRETREKIVLLLKVKTNTVNNHQTVLIWHFVTKKTIDLLEQNLRLWKLFKVHLCGNFRLNSDFIT